MEGVRALGVVHRASSKLESEDLSTVRCFLPVSIAGM